MSDRETLRTLLLEKSVTRGDFVLASGRPSSFYIDARITTMSASGLAVIGRLGLGALNHAEWRPDAIGGLTMGADPVAYAISAASQTAGQPVDAFSVRKAAKGHGAKRRIEGNFPAGGAVVVVEDVITSGGSALEAIDVVRGEGGRVLGVLCVVDREAGGRTAIEAAGYQVVALTTISELGIAPD